jgi:uncharacterized protein YyaL (SSP411 family)
VAAIAEHAIAVRVDKDEHPDIDSRYGQGGWPSTVILDPDGRGALGRHVVQRGGAGRAPRGRGRRLRTEGPTFRPPRLLPRQPTGRLDDSILPAIEAALLSHFDSRHGGFGTGQKFPHPEALDFAILRQSEHGSPGCAS